MLSVAFEGSFVEFALTEKTVENFSNKQKEEKVKILQSLFDKVIEDGIERLENRLNREKEENVSLSPRRSVQKEFIDYVTFDVVLRGAYPKESEKIKKLQFLNGLFDKFLNRIEKQIEDRLTEEADEKNIQEMAGSPSSPPITIKGNSDQKAISHEESEDESEYQQQASLPYLEEADPFFPQDYEEE